MSKYTHDLIVIGGGAAGLTATAGCAQLGLKVALVECKKLGGDCLYHGCVPSKALLKSASIYQYAKQFPRFGLPAVDLEKPDMAAINARVQKVIDQIAYHDSPERFQKLGAEPIFGNPRFISPHEVRIDGGSVISAPRIILATGSSPRAIPIPGIKEAGFLTNLDMFSLPERPDSLAIIGAGPIGVEMSHAFSRLGTKVFLLDVAPHILIKDDQDMVAVIEKKLVSEGVDIRMNVKIARVEKNGNRKTIILLAGDREEKIECDKILLSTGRQGNTENLDLDNAGVRVEKSFIVADSKLQSSQKHILAIGDCNGRMLFTHIAGAEASIAVRRFGLRLGGAMNYRATPWVTYTDPELASVGYNEQFALQDGIRYDVIQEHFTGNDRALAEEESEGKIKILIDSRQRVIGAQIVGFHAGDMLLPSLFAMGKSWKASSLISPIYPYPTMGEIYKKAVGNYMAPRLFNNKVRSILRFLYGYRGDTQR